MPTYRNLRKDRVMACRTQKRPDSSIMWMCGDAFDNTDVCRICGHIAEKLCDYPVGNDKTCDSALCHDHTINIKGEIDYCPEHAGEYRHYEANRTFSNDNNGEKNQ